MKAEQLSRLFQPFKTLLANIATRSKVVSVNSSQPIYVVLSRVRGKPSPEEIPMMQHFGFASVPPKGAEQIRVHLSSDPDNPLIMASLDVDSQPTDLVEGDSALFDNRNQFMKFQVSGISIISPDKDINITTKGANVNLTTDKSVKINAAQSVDIDAAITNLGQGGLKIARLGDIVTVTVTSGSSTGSHQGTISAVTGVNTSI